MKKSNKPYRNSDPESSKLAAERTDRATGMLLASEDIRRHPDSTGRESAERTAPHCKTSSKESIKEQTMVRRVHESKAAGILEELPARKCNASGNDIPAHSYRLIKDLSTDEIKTLIDIYLQEEKEKEKEDRKREKFFKKQNRLEEFKIVKAIEKWIEGDKLPLDTRQILLRSKSLIELEMV